jgi:MerR family transcriptional regulator, light-induced transcriptional regulator
MADTEFFSPAEVSQALGLSVTTIKRWVDAGVLPAHKTFGGHRKILLADVLRIVRERNFPFLDLSRLNLSSGAEEPDTVKLAQRLFDALQAGDIARTRSVIHGAYAAGMAMEELGDGIVAPTMSRLGHEWETGRIDVMHEHRGTMLCTAVLHELRPILETNAKKERPMAAGGNPEGDHSLVASLLVQLVLIDAGWEAVNLGPHTPLASFRLALQKLHPRLMWLSASYLLDSRRFLAEYREFYEDAERSGVAVAIGGRAIRGSLRARMPCTFRGDTLTQLAAFARTLHPRPRPPKRGRPTKQTS